MFGCMDFVQYVGTLCQAFSVLFLQDFE